MSALQIKIGTDTSIDTTEEGYTAGNAVMVESRSGTVCITGPFTNWAGWAKLLDTDDLEAADEFARRIAADPVRELTALGYDLDGWFQPLSSSN